MLSSTTSRVFRRLAAMPVASLSMMQARRAMSSSSHSFDLTGSFQVCVMVDGCCGGC